MASLVYIDETGSVGKGANKQPLLTLMAVMVDEAKVQPLAKRLKEVARDHMDWYPADFEFHGNEVWNGQGHWAGKTPDELIAAYEAVIGLLSEFDLDLAHASIHKQRLHDKYKGVADSNAYRLALQFLLEKIDRYGGTRKILVADEAKEQRLKAIKMVADLQDWGDGEVPGRELAKVIDSLHFVESHASPGVQLADMAAFAFQRHVNQWDSHPNARAAIARIYAQIDAQVRRWRAVWP
jgi:hypothetical protein